MFGYRVVICWCVASPDRCPEIGVYWVAILQVGHDPESLTANRTFDSLYVQPLLKILDSQNPDTIYTRAAPQRIK